MPDISRSSFDPTKGYTSVREQQGRVSLDADGNERTDIQLHDLRSGRVAVIGEVGGPEGEAGFELTVSGSSSMTLGNGCYFVDGIRVEVEGDAAIDLDDQPFVPDFELPSEAGTYLAYLDVWERPITAIQDPNIREVALGGADTCTRTQAVWQVRFLAVTDSEEMSCQGEFPEWDRLVAGPQGTLEVRLAEADESDNPCLVPETAGYRGLGNQLYRVQIHAGDFDPEESGGVEGSVEPTFKWSRENGSVVATWREHPEPLEITIDRLGAGGSAGFGVGDWVELSDDEDDLAERGGVLARIGKVTGDTLTLDDLDGLSATLSPVPKCDAQLHSQVRRWDSEGAISTSPTESEADLTEDGWIRIDDVGIEIRFGGSGFRSGSYWTFPVRTANLPITGDPLGWPRDGSGDSLALTATGPKHHYARLALVQRDANGVWTRLGDCRTLYPKLEDMTVLSLRSGGGQRARSHHWLPAPLTVGVSRGRIPVPDARVRFALVPRPSFGLTGGISSSAPDEDGSASGLSTPVEVQTDASGLARVWWRLGPGPTAEEYGDRFQSSEAQQLEVTLLSADGTQIHQRARFLAQALDNLHLDYAGGDGQIGKPGETLEIALRARVSDGGRPVAGARVEFVNRNRMFDGQTLDEYSGGALHASEATKLVSYEPWPEGSRMVSAVVETDDDGIAQIQWILGTETGLTVQRVEAFLLDEAGERTRQRHLYTAHLALASEIAWEPCPALAGMAKGRRHVQGGLDIMCEGFTAVGLVLQYVLGWIQQHEQLHADRREPGPDIGREHRAEAIDPRIVELLLAEPMLESISLAALFGQPVVEVVQPDGRRALGGGDRAVAGAEVDGLRIDLGGPAPTEPIAVELSEGGETIALTGTTRLVGGRTIWTPDAESRTRLASAGARLRVNLASEDGRVGLTFEPEP